MKKNLIILLLCTITLSAAAQDEEVSVKSFEKEAKIAVDERAKTHKMTEFDKDTMFIEETGRLYMRSGVSSTLEMRMLNVYDYDAYDALLNKYYKLLMAKLSADEKDVLRKAQRCWLAFRDSQEDAYDIVIPGQDGWAALMSGFYWYSLVQTRVEELYEMINPSSLEMRMPNDYNYGEYDALLNKNYKLLMAKLSADEKNILRKAQRCWLAFLVSQTDAYNVIFGSQRGSLSEYARFDLLRKRVEVLNDMIRSKDERDRN